MRIPSFSLIVLFVPTIRIKSTPRKKVQFSDTIALYDTSIEVSESTSAFAGSPKEDQSMQYQTTNEKYGTSSASKNTFKSRQLCGKLCELPLITQTFSSICSHSILSPAAYFDNSVSDRLKRSNVGCYSGSSSSSSAAYFPIESVREAKFTFSSSSSSSCLNKNTYRFRKPDIISCPSNSCFLQNAYDSCSGCVPCLHKSIPEGTVDPSVWADLSPRSQKVILGIYEGIRPRREFLKGRRISHNGRWYVMNTRPGGRMQEDSLDRKQT